MKLKLITIFIALSNLSLAQNGDTSKTISIDSINKLHAVHLGKIDTKLKGDLFKTYMSSEEFSKMNFIEKSIWYCKVFINGFHRDYPIMFWIISLTVFIWLLNFIYKRFKK